MNKQPIVMAALRPHLSATYGLRKYQLTVPVQNRLYSRNEEANNRTNVEHVDQYTQFIGV